MKKFLIIISLLFAIVHCNEKKQDNGDRDKLLYAMANAFRADCIYCTDIQSKGGDCTCFTDIAIGSCTGKAAGTGKSSSYNIKCSELTGIGNWVEIGPGVMYCTGLTCPPEAYRAAFTANGM